MTLQAGQNTVAVDCAASDDCNVNVDDISVTAPGATAAPLLQSGPLGGYLRSFDSADAFEILPRRWVAERTFAWISKHRRTVRDYERLPASHEAMILRAMIALMTRRLTQPAQ